MGHRRTSKTTDGNRVSAKIAPVAVPPTILLFDSGLGGLTVLREIVGARPDRITSMSPTMRFFPYGHHSEEQIIARVVPLIGELIKTHTPDLGGDRLQHRLHACHVASAQRIRRTVVGTVPAIKPACASSKDQARLGARHQGHRQTRIHQETDPRFRGKVAK